MIKSNGSKWKSFANPPGNKRASAIYLTSRWQRLRAELFERNGGNICRGQWHKGDRNVAKVELDHVREVQDKPELAFEPANLVFLCLDCHRQKTAAQARRRLVLDNLR
jgi:5-methylcytosine-specific restriction endonuclease McrA